MILKYPKHKKKNNTKTDLFLSKEKQPTKSFSSQIKSGKAKQKFQPNIHTNLKSTAHYHSSKKKYVFSHSFILSVYNNIGVGFESLTLSYKKNTHEKKRKKSIVVEISFFSSNSNFCLRTKIKAIPPQKVT